MPTEKPIGTGGFLDPQMIVEQFGIKEGMNIVDFGSGAGYFTIFVAKKTGPEGKVFALDILERALDSVMAKARAESIENIETIRTNLEIPKGSSLPNNSQDIVLLANILFQSKMKSSIVKEGERILKKNGKLIIIDWKKGAGGFGPPDDLRSEVREIEAIAKEENLIREIVLNTGQFHFGLIFKKQQG